MPLELFSIAYECIPGFLFFALLRYVIGLELTRVTISTNRIQNLNQRATWSLTLAFSLSSHRVLIEFSSAPRDISLPMICCCDCFGFG